MFRWAIGFLVLALVAAFLGFGGIAGTAASVAKIIFIVALVAAIIGFVMGGRGSSALALAVATGLGVYAASGRVAHADPLMSTQLGIAAGGGYNAFAHGNVANATDGGPGWDVRLILGAHSPLAIEVAYVGANNGLSAFQDISILSNSIEGNLRLSTPALERIPVQFYALGGLGVNWFSLRYSGPNTTTVRDADTTVSLPVGAGMQFNITEHVLFDTRFTYRFMFDSDLDMRQDRADMYAITGRIGFVL